MAVCAPWSAMPASGGLWPTEVAALYGIPLDRDVSKVCVGIIALGGGYLDTDLAQALAGWDGKRLSSSTSRW